MCILCVIQKWSRRVATMLPWLVIPLIGLWALSQIFPPAYQFEITSPRLACVFVLLFTLFWYEVLMPQLSTWQVRRTARIRERKRFEAIEMQKLRKTATRRCRNCLNPYRDQNPAGGRFMCSYCGHISKRPVLDLPVPPGLGLSNSGILKGLVGKGGKIWSGKAWADNGCMCGEDWLENGNWVGGSSGGNSCYFRKNGGGAFGGNDHCMAEKSYYCVIFASKILTAFFLSIRWLWRKICRISSSADDASSETEHRDIWAERGENGEDIHESRGEKARRKAEEKKQARLERELLEEEERKQREEVARLVEERRKLRDEILMAEKSRGKGSNSDRDKDSKKEAEKMRQERRKEQDKGSSKSNSDAEELDRRKEKDKGLLKTTGEIDRREHYKTAAESAKAHSADTVHGFKSATVNNHCRENAGTRYLDRMRGTFLSSSKAFSGGSFFGRGANTYASVARENKPNSSVDHIQTSVRELSRSEHVSATSNIIGDDKSIDHPVLFEPQPRTTTKKSWQQLFTRSSAFAPAANTNVISRPNAKVQTEVQSPPVSGHKSESQSYINPINFGLPSPFTLPTFPYATTSNSTVLSLASEAMFPRFGEAPLECLPEESDIFEEPCFVPDPVSLLGPVSESLDNFQLDLGGGFVPGMGLEKPHALKNISTSSEATRPSPIGSPMLRSRVSDERHSCSNPFPCTPEAQFKPTLPVDDLSNSNDIGTWQMWNTSPLGQDGLGLFMHPIAHETMTSLFTENDQALSGTHSSPNIFLGNAQNGGAFGTHIPCSTSDPWLPKTLLGAMPDSENHFSLNPAECTSQQTEMIYGSPNASATNHPLDLPPANCWTKKEWPVPGSGEGTRNSSIQRPHVGGLYSNPDVQSFW